MSVSLRMGPRISILTLLFVPSGGQERTIASDASRKATIIEALQKATIIFVGEVRSLGPEPSFWSGRSAAYQSVEYRIDRTLKGKASSDKIKVDHAVVKNSPTARDDRPGLSPEFFRRGRNLIIGLEEDKERNDPVYVQPWSVAAEETVRQAVRSKPATR